MSCKQGNSIRAGKISSYQALIERSDLQSNKPYELSYQGALSVYQEVISNLKSKGYSGLIKPFRQTVLSQDKHQVTLTIQRKSEFDYVHPDTQVARMAAMLQNVLIVNTGNLGYINSFIKRIRSNISRLSQAYLKPYYSGYCIQTLQSILSVSDVNILRQFIPFVNSNLESCSLVSIDIDQEPIMPSDINVMIGTLDRDMFKDLIERYQDWHSHDTLEVKEQDIRASIHLMLKDKQYPKSAIDIKISQKNRSWVMGVASQTTISPYLILKTLYPKIKLNEIYQHSNFIVLDCFKSLDRLSGIQTDSKTCQCGNSLVYSHINKRVSGVCQDCYIRSLMAKFINQ